MNANRIIPIERALPRALVAILTAFTAGMLSVAAAETSTPAPTKTDVLRAAIAALETNAPPGIASSVATNAPSEANPSTPTNAPAAAAAAATTSAAAAETKPAEKSAPPPLTPQEFFEGGKTSFNNWIDLTAGGFYVSGNESRFRQERQSQSQPFGGISDFHYQSDLAKGTHLTADGRALFDEHDYKLIVNLVRDKVGFVRLSYTEFRTWYDGDGGFYPPTGAWFPLNGDGLALDRGEISFEAGLRMEKVPNITFKYSHDFRDGDKSSTSWGYTHPAGGTLTRGLSPSFYHIDESRDTFQLDVDHHIKKTDLGVGLRYETGDIGNALKITQFPGEAIQQRITDKQSTEYDMFNVHAYTETWFKKNLMLSSGFAYSHLDNDFSGSRIYGANFDVPYAPDPQNGFGYSSMQGNSSLNEYVMNLNLLATISKHFSIVPSLRASMRNLDASFVGTETLADNAPAPFNGNSFRDDLEVRERLDVKYTGITNWVLGLRGEWTEGEGNMTENGGLVPIGGVGVPPIQRQTDDSRLLQKYSANVRWYPLRRLTANLGGYYKLSSYDYEHNVDSTPNNSPNRYPAYLVAQSIETWDANANVTLRPLQNVSLVTRYEIQWSTFHTRPDPISGLGEAQSGEVTSQLIGETVAWSPWSRLSLQAGLNYVLSATTTPARDFTPAILKAQNNYWTVNFLSSLVLDDRTDLNINFFYYRANDYVNNSADGVPYGAGAEDYGVSAAIVRRISKNVRLNLKYAYYRSTDAPSGGHSDYDSHFVSTSWQYRF